MHPFWCHQCLKRCSYPRAGTRRIKIWAPKQTEAEPKPNPSRAEPSRSRPDADPKPNRSRAEAEPKQTARGPKPNPSRSEAEPKPTEADPKPKVSRTQAEAKPSRSEPKPSRHEQETSTSRLSVNRGQPCLGFLNLQYQPNRFIIGFY